MENKIPKINELKEDDSKFIQVYIKGEPYLMFAPKKKDFYHGFMLEEILNKLGIKFDTFRDKSLFADIPLKEDSNSNYKLVGAGLAYYISEDVIEFYDSSVSYHVGTNLKHLEDVFKDKKVKIEKYERDSDVYRVYFNFEPDDKEKDSDAVNPGIKSNLNLEDISEETPF